MKSKNFKEVTLGEVSIGNKGSYGIGASAVDYSEDLFTYLRITDINDDGIINKEGLKSVKDDKAENYILKTNDIVFARTGNSTGRSYFYDKKDGELVYAGFLIKFNLDPEKINPKYMRYYALSSEYRYWIEAVSTGSTRKNINAKMYANMDIKLPSRKQQGLLVDTLSSLDNKIEVNNKINKNLEQQAQEIFKHWFVDFEFPDKNGKPYKSSGGKMMESELGMIPEGWEVVKLSDLVTHIESGNWGKEKKEGNYTEKIFCVRGTDIPAMKKGQKGNMPERYIIPKHLEMKALKQDNIVMEKSGGSPTQSTGRVLYVNEELLNNYSEPLLCTNFCKVLNVKKGYEKIFYYNWEYLYSLGYMFSFENGTTGIKNLDEKSLLENSKLAIPSLDLLLYFNKYLSKINTNKSVLGVQNQTLSQLRDTLLPKLMSGEIRIPLD